MATAWIFTGLTEGLGLGFTAVGVIGGGINSDGGGGVGRGSHGRSLTASVPKPTASTRARERASSVRRNAGLGCMAALGSEQFQEECERFSARKGRPDT